MNKKSIGIFDSGKGGYETLKFLKKEFKEVHFIFYADIKHAPYGTKKKSELVSILMDVIHKFERLKVRFLLFACNTASTLIPLLQKNTRLKLISVIEATLFYRDYFNIASKNTLLLATKFTVLQGVYQKYFSPITCVYNNQLIDDIQKNLSYDLSFLREYNNQKFDLVLLACTHFTVIQKELSDYILYEKVIDTAQVFIIYLRNKINL